MKKLIYLFVIVMLLSGCATAPEAIMKKNNDSLLQLDMGMTKEQVIEKMGKPDLNEAYQSLDGKPVAIFFYYTQRKWSDGNVTKDECTPLVFEDGKLVGWGDEFYKHKTKIDLSSGRPS